MDQAPSRFPLQAAEKILKAGRSLGLVMGMIQLEMEFEARLDPQRLRRSLDLLLIQHPILACRLDAQAGKSFWQWSETKEPLLLLTQSPEAFDQFRISLADPAQGPQLSACLWQRPSGASLLLKVTHEVSDAGGVKEIGMDFAGLYTRLEKEPDYTPAPNLQGSRSGWQVLQYLPRHKWPGIIFDFLKDLWANFVPRDSVTLPLPLDPGSPVTYVIRHLPAERVSSLAGYGRSRNATLNDMVISAFYRALAKQGKGDKTAALRLQTTVDLRRYMPEERAEEICNLSAMAYPFLGKELGKDFEQTLERVAAIIRFDRGRGMN